MIQDQFPVRHTILPIPTDRLCLSLCSTLPVGALKPGALKPFLNSCFSILLPDTLQARSLVSLELSEGGIGWMGFIAGLYVWVDSRDSPQRISSELGTIPVSAIRELP